MNLLNHFRNYHYKKFKELSNNISGIFSLNSILISFREIKISKHYQGENLFLYHVYQNVWDIKWFDLVVKRKLFFLISTKALVSFEKSWNGDFLELWEYTLKNKIKKKSLIYLPFIEEIWDFVWNISEHNTERLGTVLICCGFKILIFDLPKVLPQFMFLKKGLCSISLMNIYQWKIDCKHSKVITADIRGSITVFNLKDNFYMIRFFHNSSKNVPVNIIKIFLFHKLSRKIRFLISAGYDGIIKLWDIEKPTSVVAEIFFPKRWINDIQLFSQRNYYSIFSISFENGFISYWNVITGTVFNIKFLHQISTWKAIQLECILFLIGEDGDLNIIEINSPFFLDKKFLFFLQTTKYFHTNFLFSKFRFNCLQSLSRNFFLKAIGLSPFIEKDFLITTSGNSGILIFYKFTLN